MNLSKKTRRKLWQLHGAMLILEERNLSFDEIIFRAASNLLDLVRKDADEKAKKDLGFEVSAEGYRDCANGGY